MSRSTPRACHLLTVAKQAAAAIDTARPGFTVGAARRTDTWGNRGDDELRTGAWLLSGRMDLAARGIGAAGGGPHGVRPHFGRLRGAAPPAAPRHRHH